MNSNLLLNSNHTLYQHALREEYQITDNIQRRENDQSFLSFYRCSLNKFSKTDEIEICELTSLKFVFCAFVLRTVTLWIRQLVFKILFIFVSILLPLN